MFRSTTVVKFTATAGASTFIDAFTRTVHSIHAERRRTGPLGGRRCAHPARRASPTRTCSRVVADAEYTNSGEGLHRFVDPVDNEVYLYSQFEVPDSRRVFAVFEQPDLKAPSPSPSPHPPTGSSCRNSPTPEPVMNGELGHLGVRADPGHLVVHHRNRRRPVRGRAQRAHQQRRTDHPARHLLAQVAQPVPRRRLHLREDPSGLRLLREQVRLRRTRSRSTTSCSCPSSTRAPWRTPARSRSPRPTSSGRR